MKCTKCGPQFSSYILKFQLPLNYATSIISFPYLALLSVQSHWQVKQHYTKLYPKNFICSNDKNVSAVLVVWSDISQLMFSAIGEYLRITQKVSSINAFIILLKVLGYASRFYIWVPSFFLETPVVFSSWCEQANLLTHKHWFSLFK